MSHRHKFIFLKTTKTAGTSVEISLSRYCGPGDVITPISPDDEKIRSELGIRPRNFTRLRSLGEFGQKDLKRVNGKNPILVKKFWNHMSATSVKNVVGEEIWDSYYKFCIVRNPWDRAISRYYWNLKRKGDSLTLSESLRKYNPASNLEIYTIDGELIIDGVCKYETLLTDLQTVCVNLDLPFDGWLPQAKGNFRKDRRHYREILSPEDAAYIKEVCHQEIEWFGYEY